MEINKQVCNLEWSKKLDEIMPRQESLFAYYGNAGRWSDAIVDMAMYKDADEDFRKHKLLPAYTVAELGEMLPTNIIKEGRLVWLVCKKEFIFNEEKTPVFTCEYSNNEGLDEGHTTAYTEANARAKMLHYLLSNGLLQVKDIK